MSGAVQCHAATVEAQPQAEHGGGMRIRIKYVLTAVDGNPYFSVMKEERIPVLWMRFPMWKYFTLIKVSERAHFERKFMDAGFEIEVVGVEA